MSHTRLNKERYAIRGEWEYRAHRHGLVDRGMDVQPALIEVKVADLLEKQSGHVWKQGAFKVILQNVPDMRTKTFYGETAHHDAARYASDAATKCGDWGWRPDL